MKTGDVKSLALGPGLVAGGMKYHSSMVHHDGSNGLASSSVVETFEVVGQDKSRFLITITRLHVPQEPSASGGLRVVP